MSNFTGKFSCVFCGQQVNYDAKKYDLVCSNPKCPENDPSYGFNPLQDCVWAEVTLGKEWISMPKTYILSHKQKFGLK